MDISKTQNAVEFTTRKQVSYFVLKSKYNSISSLDDQFTALTSETSFEIFLNKNTKIPPITSHGCEVQEQILHPIPVNPSDIFLYLPISDLPQHESTHKILW